MQFLRASLAIALMSIQGACSVHVEPIEKKPLVSIEKGGLFGGFVKAELFEDNQLQRSQQSESEGETAFQIEQLREGAFTAARDYLLSNPVRDNPDNLILECDSYTVIEYIATNGENEKYTSMCSYQPLEDHFRELESIILEFSNKSNKGGLLP